MREPLIIFGAVILNEHWGVKSPIGRTTGWSNKQNKGGNGIRFLVFTHVCTKQINIEIIKNNKIIPTCKGLFKLKLNNVFLLDTYTLLNFNLRGKSLQ